LFLKLQLLKFNLSIEFSIHFLFFDLFYFFLKKKEKENINLKKKLTGSLKCASIRCKKNSPVGPLK